MMNKTFLACAIAAGSLSLAGLATAGPIEDRQALMKANGKAIGAIVAMVKKEAPFDAAAVKQNAAKIADDLAKVKDLFPEGSDKGPPETWAKPEIWTDRAGFTAALNKAYEAAEAMEKVTAEADLGAALGAMGEGCKGCHEKYRRPKEQ